jgi:4-nitrophenyl phosphatase
MSDDVGGALPPLRLVLFDLDGVVYRGDEPVAGARELVAALHDAGVLVRFATNNSMATRSDFAARLSAMGIPTTVDEIVTSVSATVDHLRRREPAVRRVLAVGEQGLVSELAAAGYAVTPAAEAAPNGYAGGPLAEAYDAVVVGLDRSFDYQRLAVAVAAIVGGARFVATNTDFRYPTPDGFLPGAGTVVAAIATGSRATPTVIGKPEPGMFTAALEAAGVGCEEAIVVGDNPDSDILAARRAGIRSVLVLTGVTDRRAAANLVDDRRPDAVVADPTELARLVASLVSR